MDNHIVNNNPDINDIIEVDGWARDEAMRVYNNLSGIVSINTTVTL